MSEFEKAKSKAQKHQKEAKHRMMGVAKQIKELKKLIADEKNEIEKARLQAKVDKLSHKDRTKLAENIEEIK